MAWWESFFDADYRRIWESFTPPEQTEREVEGLWELLGLRKGMRVLDAPCGYGRHALLLAAHGAIVLGVDQSEAMLSSAEAERGPLPPGRLRFLRHDLRMPLAEGDFDVAVNLFTSLGYGTEKDDLAILRTLRGALRPRGRLFLETNHRDAVVAFFARGGAPSRRLADGTLVIEEPKLDPVRGRIETCWYWRGPGGSGQKEASLRLYTVTELVRLVERAGLEFRSAHAGCTPAPFLATGPEMGGRVGLLAVRP
jgi:SAM-dependent methyltransferase